jgi:hypothetical protein
MGVRGGRFYRWKASWSMTVVVLDLHGFAGKGNN